MSISATVPAATREARISIRLAVGVTVLVASALHAALALRVPVPWITPDELRYSELAKSLGDGRLPAIRDHVTFGFGLGYPLLLAPIWALVNDVGIAYPIAKVLNSIVMGLTAVPAFLLARRFVGDRSALAAAALSVAIPSLLYAGMLMTEVALYPLFVLALYAIVVALDRPTPATQLAALGAIALASTVKVLALALLVGYVAAVFLFHLADTRDVGSWVRRLRTYATTWLVLVAIGSAAILAAAATSRSATELLGTYQPYLKAANVLELPKWMLFHVAAFDVSVAVIPFAATTIVIAAGLRARADRQVRLLAVTCLTLSAPVFAAVAAYSSVAEEPVAGYASGAGANERATFVLAPLALVALMVWLRDRSGSRRSLVIAAFVAGLLPAVIPLDQFAENVVRVQAFSLIPWVETSQYAHGRAGMVIASLVLGLLFLVLALTRAPAFAFIATVGAVFIAVTLVANTLILITADWTRLVGIGNSPGWVDKVAGHDRVSVLWYEPPGRPWVPLVGRHRIIWLNEFYNRSIGDVYEIGSPVPYGVDLPATPVRLSSGRVVLEDGRPAPLGPLVLAPCFVRVEGKRIASDPATKTAVYRVGSTARVRVSAPDSHAPGC